MITIPILGAGVGALSAALYLHNAGCRVSLLEKNRTPGGKLGRLVHHDFSFDIGPTVLTMPFVLEALFAMQGESIQEMLTLERVEPTCRYHWSDGTIFDAWGGGDRLDDELRRVFPDDADAVRSFLAEIARLYEATKDIFLFNQFEGIREFVKLRNTRLLPMLPRLGLISTMERSLRRRFRSPKLVQFFSRFATYNGSSPYRAPATLNVIPHVELRYGAWYPRGGMAAITDALVRLVDAAGIEMRTSTPVEGVRREGRRITGVMAGGELFPADAVVSNIDVLWTWRNLLEPAGIPTPRSVAGAERSCSGFLMLLAVRGTHPRLAHHNIFFSDHYREEFIDIFERKSLPRSMTIYLSISSKTDPTLAPPGCENWYLLVNAPAGGREHHDAGAQERYADAVLERLKSFGLDPDIVWRSRLTPVDIEQRDNSVDGAIYGASSNSIFSAFLRPRNKAPGLDNLYFVGGSTHPGGGVPLAILSGKIVAEEVISCWKLS